MTEKNNNSTIVKEDSELIRFQFTDDTRQTLESVTVFLKDRFAEYGYLPATDVIPIEWLKKQVKEALDERRIDDALFLKECLAKWEEENG